jgi:hypothetical protein
MRLAFCVACGRTTDLNHHHLWPKVLDGPDDESNLITLCRECHGKIHGAQWALGHADAIKTGLARARQKGVRLGRRPTSKRIEERISELRSTGMGILKIARTLGIGTSVVQRVIA